ncbi:hypothetical protein EDB89DRAFT_2015695 [Lactarius sanguifluus]|nr:hypothetical protein EDB89DRAFT_2015695 [Lactarius sanguifluus]
MAARAAAEMETKAAADKALPAPPVPSGKPLGHSELRRPSAKDVFGKEQVDAEPETVPRMPSLSALSLLRPPQRHDQPVFAARGPKTEDSGLDALERRLVEQVGTRKYPPAPTTMADPPPAPVPAPVPVPGRGKSKAAPAEELESADEVLGGGAGVNESAISSLALGAEDFGGRNASAANVLAGLEQEGDGEDVEGDDADRRTQRLRSSSSERGTHKARSRKSAKSDAKDREKKTKKKREWLEKLAPPEPERQLVVSDAEVKQDTSSPSLPQEPAPEPTVTADPAPAQGLLTVVESKLNQRSSSFISVATLRRAHITLPAPESASPAQSNAQRVANRYQPPPQVEMKYDVKSARGGRGGRVTAVASIWAEATKAGGASAPTQAAQATKATGNPAQPKAVAHKAKPIKPMTSIVALGARTAQDDDGRVPLSRGRPTAPASGPAPPAKAEKEDVLPTAAARVSRALFGLGVAAVATPSSPALSSSITTPPPPPTSQQSQQPAATGWQAPLVSGAGLKADLAFGQARLRDLIRRYQGHAA